MELILSLVKQLKNGMKSTQEQFYWYLKENPQGRRDVISTAVQGRTEGVDITHLTWRLSTRLASRHMAARKLWGKSEEAKMLRKKPKEIRKA